MVKRWSYWEKTQYWAPADLCIIGAGITGLSAAIFAKQSHPKEEVIVLERGFLPEGASTKNAGFACYGSLGELRDDILENGYDACLRLVKERYEGLNFLRDLVPDKEMDYSSCGGVELFNSEQAEEWEACRKLIPQLNKDLRPVFGADVYAESNDYQAFSNCIGSIRSPFEGSLNPAKMMQSLYRKAISLGIKVYYNCEVSSYKKEGGLFNLKLNQLPDLQASKLLLCTNAFSTKFGNFDLQAVRNMVLVSKEINWPFPNAVYHAQMGYFYFRRVGNRLLIGGGRHLARAEETSSEFGINPKVKNALLQFTKNYLGLEVNDLFEEEWSGILGVGKKKEPIIEELQAGLFTAFRLGGMGVAIGSRTGYKVVEKIYGERNII
jgi:gamma-glutamylputrescine oxidase